MTSLSRTFDGYLPGLEVVLIERPHLLHPPSPASLEA
jgi:hypothetical protein